MVDSELNIQNYQFYLCNREIKLLGGCLIYALDSPTTSKVDNGVLESLFESV